MPETPICDIVDRCRVWESHADSAEKRERGPRPGRALPTYALDDVGEVQDDLPVAAVTASPTVSELLESLLQRLLPTPVVSQPDVTPIPAELELLLQRLLGDAQLAPPEKPGFTAMEVLLQNLLPVSPSLIVRPQPYTGRRNWMGVLYFSCGKT